MISKPVSPSLLITQDTVLGGILQNYLADLVLTIPVYIFIFWLMWELLNYYQFSPMQYIFVFALAQALGDGGAYFVNNPFMISFIPVTMLNYHAMNVAAFLKIQPLLHSKERSNTIWRYLTVIVAIISAYLVGGAYIRWIALALGLSLNS